MTVNFYGDGTLLKTVEAPPVGLPKDFSVNVDGISDFKIEVISPHYSYVGNYMVGFANLKLQ